MHNTNGRNHLYTLRRIRGLGQKQLAQLLGYRGTGMISRFEHGLSLPPLQVVLLMEMAFGARAQDIWVDLHQHLRRLMLKRTERLPSTAMRHIRGRLLGRDDT